MKEMLAKTVQISFGYKTLDPKTRWISEPIELNYPAKILVNHNEPASSIHLEYIPGTNYVYVRNEKGESIYGIIDSESLYWIKELGMSYVFNVYEESGVSPYVKVLEQVFKFEVGHFITCPSLPENARFVMTI